MRNLIINADDFGLHLSVNEAIIAGHKDGCITSTSLMASGQAGEAAAAVALTVPTLGVGVHLTLVAERPVLPPEEIPSLVDENGCFWADHMVFIKKYIAGKISLLEVRRECEAQLKRIQSWGIMPTHIDSHQHLHVLPKIFTICLDLAKENGINKMRLPAEPCGFSGKFPATFGRKIAKCGLTALAEIARVRARRQGIYTPDSFFGMVAGGHMQECFLRAILEALPTGTSEIMIHPGRDNVLLQKQYGWPYHWEEEFQAVTSTEILNWIKENHVNLISFKELSHE